MIKVAKLEKKRRKIKPPKPPSSMFESFFVALASLMTIIWLLTGMVDDTGFHILWVFISLFSYWIRSNNSPKSFMYKKKPAFWVFIATGGLWPHFIINVYDFSKDVRKW